MLSPLSDVAANITMAHCDAVGRGHPLHQFSVANNRRLGLAGFAYLTVLVISWPWTLCGQHGPRVSCENKECAADIDRRFIRGLANRRCNLNEPSVRLLRLCA
jgi:hypothetical protein